VTPDRRRPSSSFWSSRRLLVTGASGFLGRVVCAQAEALGADVTGLVRADGPPSVTLVRADIADPDAVGSALEGRAFDAIVHLAGVSDADAAEQGRLWDTNVRGTWGLLEVAAAQPEMPIVVLASSALVYGSTAAVGPAHEESALDGTNPYAVSKHCAELISRSYAATGLPVLVTRPSNLYGPGDRSVHRLVPSAIASVLDGRPPVLRSPGSSRDFAYVDDVAAAHLLAVEALAARPELSGTAVNLASGRSHTSSEVVDLIQHVAGTDFEVPSHPEPVPATAFAVDASRAAQQLGWSAATDLDEGLRRTVAWHREQRR
jgi:CDP-glucose 4,6-dehydratase